MSAAAPVQPGLLQVVRAGYGAALLLAPGTLIRLCTRRPASGTARNVTRLLGARHLIQAWLTAGGGPRAGYPSATRLRIGAAADLAHAASMAGLAAADPPLRAATLTDALIETGLAATGLASARRRGGEVM